MPGGDVGAAFPGTPGFTNIATIASPTDVVEIPEITGIITPTAPLDPVETPTTTESSFELSLPVETPFETVITRTVSPLPAYIEAAAGAPSEAPAPPAETSSSADISSPAGCPDHEILFGPAEEESPEP
ncbi:hypothetical protein MKZ38_005147 [Zalerion maritima]|uniref:Uncharacterized protein n=1 Tax=Zalerion maritima TaxID=339359 RepID=A0AAD5RLN1_9PEZI|nr:hypothetical protein MKZ38_005147 [Zalerion maritima]